MRPRVILHTAISLDGKATGFMPDMERFYGLVSRWSEDITLAGSDTILLAPDPIPPETEADLASPPPAGDPSKSLLAVVDSRGRVRSWHYLRALPFWRGGMALCSEKTPREYLEYLDQRHIEYMIVGKDRVDYRAALEALYTSKAARAVRVETGGTLGSILLREGLVDEISLVIHPCLVGRASQTLMFHAEDFSGSKAPRLRLAKCERLGEDLVWLDYEVSRA